MTKRTKLIYFVISMWVATGSLAIHKGADLTSLAVYFGSLVACVASYVWGETKRESSKPTKKVPKSEREKVVYVSSLLWLFLGVYAIFGGVDLKSCAAFFGSLNGFVVSFVVGETYKGSDGETILKKQS